MNIVQENLGANALGERWWMLVVRGIAAILFGVVAIVWPGMSLLALVLLWGAYALIDGGTALGLAVKAGRAGGRWGWLFFEALVSIAAAAATAVWPGITALALLMLIAGWAVFTGIAEIAAAIELRHVIRGEWLLALGGILSIVFGVLMFLFPGAGALAVITLIGAYAIAFGGVLTALGFRVHHWATHVQPPFLGGTPTHA
jgi:uncharacterized membrane protein HdeD (DUF308 family)